MNKCIKLVFDTITHFKVPYNSMVSNSSKPNSAQVMTANLLPQW